MIHTRVPSRWRSGDAVPVPFTCPECVRTSHHPEDERHRYCGACHKFFPPPLVMPADFRVIGDLITEARVIMAHGVADELPEHHRTHWRAVVAWLQSHLPPEDAATDDTLPCGDCLDMGVLTDDGTEWRACTCLVGRHLDDLSA